MKKLKKLTVALALSAIFATGAVHAAVLDFTSPSISTIGNVSVTPSLATLSGDGLSTLTMDVTNISGFQWLFTSQTPMSWNQWESWYETSYVSINGGNNILLADMTSWVTSGIYNLGPSFSGTLTFGFDSTYFANMNDFSQSSLQISAVPEPETYAMLLAGLGLLGFTARRRKNLYA